MTKPLLLLGAHSLAFSILVSAQTLDNAEVRLPYSELKQLLANVAANTKPIPKTPKPVLLSARLKLSLENDRPVINATFRTVSFNTDVTLIPLIDGDVSLEKSDPEDTTIASDGKSLCIVSNKPETHTAQLRLLPIQSENTFTFSIPPCPSVILETENFPADQSILLDSNNKEETLAAGQVRPLSNTGLPTTIRLLNSRETHEALSPPEPSTWTWQNQALVNPTDSDLIYHIITRASASNGSGMEAMLALPPDAQDVSVTGEDLVSQTKIRGENRSLAISLLWKTRGILDRQIAILYRMPLRPLDPSWHLQAPGGDNALTRFMIANSPLLAYAADGLSAPLLPQGLPSAFAETLHGATYQYLESKSTADLTTKQIPIAATDDGVVNDADWTLKIEPDGSMLVSGNLTIEHKNPLGFVFDTPDGMKLLSCEVGGKPVTPIDLGNGSLKVILPPLAENSRLSCSFTGRTNALDPVEGTVKLSLPKIPLFIHSLLWRLDLPAGYQAETHGNLKRIQVAATDTPSRIALRKNLCRDERPEVHVFYQRSDLNR